MSVLYAKVTIFATLGKPLKMGIPLCSENNNQNSNIFTTSFATKILTKEQM